MRGVGLPARRRLAKKAWFFAGDQVVCLGAGIGATEKVTAPIATSVNQCRLNGAVRMCAGGQESAVETANTHADDLAWSSTTAYGIASP